MRRNCGFLHNAMKDIGDSISFRLRGKKSNRDAIGTAITVEVGSAAPDKISAGGIRVSGPAFQRGVLRTGKAGRNDPSHDSLAERALSGIEGSARESSDRDGGRLGRICGQTLRCASSCLRASRTTADARAVAHSGGHMARSNRYGHRSFPCPISRANARTSKVPRRLRASQLLDDDRTALRASS